MLGKKKAVTLRRDGLECIDKLALFPGLDDVAVEENVVVNPDKVVLIKRPKTPAGGRGASSIDSFTFACHATAHPNEGIGRYDLPTTKARQV